MPVNILAKICNAVISPRCQVGDVDGQRLAQVDHGRFRRGNDIIDAILGPSLYTAHAKNLFGKVERSGQTNTTVTEGAHTALEQAVRGTVVQIDIMGVWEHELYTAECVVRPRSLPQLVWKVPGSSGGPVDCTGICHLAAPDHFKPLRGQARRVFSKHR